MNPETCVVCNETLIQETVPGSPFDADNDVEELDEDPQPIVASIHCPRCQLLYRVVDPCSR